MSLEELYSIGKGARKGQPIAAGDGVHDGADASVAVKVAVRLCTFCHTNQARYNCPSCNSPYCSLGCFHSKAHGNCSSAFSDRALREHFSHADLREASHEERTKMMEVLRRMELEDGEEQESEEDGGGHSDAVDGKMSSNATHSSAEGVDEQVLPWWEQPLITNEAEAGSRIASTELINLVNASMTAGESGMHLMPNLLAIVIAYAVTVRHFGTTNLDGLDSSDSDDPNISKSAALAFLEDLVPFLFAQPPRSAATSEGDVSKTQLNGTHEPVMWVISRLSDEIVAPASTTKLMNVLLADSETILFGSSSGLDGSTTAISHITELHNAHDDFARIRIARHPHLSIALDDLSQFLKGSVQTNARRAHKKLLYYSAKFLALEHQAEKHWQDRIAAYRKRLTAEDARTIDEQRWKARDKLLVRTSRPGPEVGTRSSLKRPTNQDILPDHERDVEQANRIQIL